MSIKVLLLGATGYIGSSLLPALLALPDYEVTIFIRDGRKEQEFKDRGVKTVIVDSKGLDAAEILQAEAAKADIVINTAHADHLNGVQSLLKGMYEHKVKSGKTSKFIHTSGTGVLVCDSRGAAPSHEDPIYCDTSRSSLESIPKNAMHREVDLAIVSSDEKREVDSYIILPGTIYGIGLGDTRSTKGLRSQQIPQLIQACIERGMAGAYGEGLNSWPHVEISDLIDLYIILLKQVSSGNEKLGQGKDGFYFAVSGDYVYKAVALEIAEKLVSSGKGKTNDYKPLSEEQLKKQYNDMGWYLGTNCLCKAERARQIGWAPKKSNKEFMASISEEFDNAIGAESSAS